MQKSTPTLMRSSLSGGLMTRVALETSPSSSPTGLVGGKHRHLRYPSCSNPSFQEMPRSTPCEQVLISFNAHDPFMLIRLVQINFHKLAPCSLGFPSHSGYHKAAEWLGFHDRDAANRQTICY